MPPANSDPNSNDDNAVSQGDETGKFNFDIDIEPVDRSSDSKKEQEQVVDLNQTELERLAVLVRHSPTSNRELASAWGIETKEELRQYLDETLEGYYYRDDERYIRPTNEAEEIVEETGAIQEISGHNSNLDSSSTRDTAALEQSHKGNIHKRDLLLDLVRLTQQLDQLPTADDINEYGEYTHQQYRTMFDSLFVAYKEAGVLPEHASRSDIRDLCQVDNQMSGAEPRPSSKTVQSNDTPREGDVEGLSPRAKMIADLQGIDEDIDRVPYPSDLPESEFSQADYRDEFGSWNEALEAADINKRKRLLNELGRVSEKLGNEPSMQEMNEHSRYSTGIYTRLFGSWGEAKKAWKNSSQSSEQEIDSDTASSSSETGVDDTQISDDDMSQEVAYRLRKYLDDSEEQ